MLDAIFLEKRGIPAANVGEEYLMKSVGAAMMKLHGMPNLPIATIPHARALETILKDEDDLRVIVEIAAPQVEAILLGK